MIGILNHVAVAVPDLEKAAATYRDVLGARVSAPLPQPPHGVTVVFVELPNAKVELLHPLGEHSPIKAFLDKNPAGGMHHICFEVNDIIAARDQLQAKGARVLSDGEPKIGAHNKPVLVPAPQGPLRLPGGTGAGLTQPARRPHAGRSSRLQRRTPP
jgi:methylmalonyl-CoA/ethylmalonyl-CoA epimerase